MKTVLMRRETAKNEPVFCVHLDHSLRERYERYKETHLGKKKFNFSEKCRDLLDELLEAEGY